MKILSVTFKQPLSLSDPELRKAAEPAIPNLQQLPGLIWKIWTDDVPNGRGASFYLFDTEENARAWGDGPLLESLAALPGYSDPEVTYYDVDEELSKGTFAPLYRAEQA